MEAFSRKILTSKEARALIEHHVGYDFDEKSVINALESPNPYDVAERVSGHKVSGAFKIDEIKAKQHYLNLASTQASLVWQLDNLNHERFKETVDEETAEAKNSYLIDRQYKTPVVGQWIDMNMWMLDGMFNRRTGRGVRLNKSGRRLFHRGLFAAEWIAVYLAALTLLATLWIGGKL